MSFKFVFVGISSDAVKKFFLRISTQVPSTHYVGYEEESVKNKSSHDKKLVRIWKRCNLNTEIYIFRFQDDFVKMSTNAFVTTKALRFHWKLSNIPKSFLALNLAFDLISIVSQLKALWVIWKIWSESTLKL